MHQVSDDFVNCWHTAIMHLQTKGREVIKWLKSDLIPPFLEHTSFRIGNQLFFVQIEDKDNELDTPSNLDGLRMITNGCDGVACLMPMRRKGVSWEVVEPGWGLIDPQTREIINPYDLVTNEHILMTDWEIQDFAVQVVRNYLTDKLNFKIQSSQSNPLVYPSIWFKEQKQEACVIVNFGRYGYELPQLPKDTDKIIESFSQNTHKVYFGSVLFYHPNQKDTEDILPLYRGHETGIKFSELKLLN